MSRAATMLHVSTASHAGVPHALCGVTNAQMRDVQFYLNATQRVAASDQAMQDELQQATVMAVGAPSRARASLARRAETATGLPVASASASAGAGAGAGAGEAGTAAAHGSDGDVAGSPRTNSTHKKRAAGSKSKRGSRKKKGKRKR